MSRYSSIMSCMTRSIAYRRRGECVSCAASDFAVRNIDLWSLRLLPDALHLGRDRAAVLPFGRMPSLPEVVGPVRVTGQVRRERFVWFVPATGHPGMADPTVYRQAVIGQVYARANLTMAQTRAYIYSDTSLEYTLRSPPNSCLGLYVDHRFRARNPVDLRVYSLDITSNVRHPETSK